MMSSPDRVGPGRFSLSALAIRRHIGTLMITLTVVVLGIYATLQLPVDLLPAVTYPRIGLRVTAPGLAPTVALDEVTRPLEEAMALTEGVGQVVSQTREGRISLDLFFPPGSDIDQALNEATAALNAVRDRLPDTIDTPRLFKFEPSSLPVYELALTSPSLPPVALRVFAEQELARDLQQLPGVGAVAISGGVTEEVQVNIDLQRLQGANLDLTTVLTTLAERNQDVSGGRLRGGQRELLSRLVGRFTSVDDIRRLPLAVPGTEPLQHVYLDDVATIVDGTEEQRIFVTLNGTPAVKLSVRKQPTANTVQVIDAVKTRLDQLRASGLVPPDMTLVATLDESIFVRGAIANVATAGLAGALLAGLTVLLFLGSWRQTLIVVLAIPLAVLVALMGMALLGLSLNLFSLGGLALGVGIVVDNAIVMLENLAQGEGRSLGEAVARSQELESALVASTATNLVAVVPFLLIGGLIALLFNQLILTISLAIGASLAVALTVVPALAARLGVGARASLQGWGPVAAFNRRLAGLTQRYGQVLRYVLSRRLLVVGLALVLLGGGSVALVRTIPQEILPRIDSGQARLFARFPPGTPLADSRAVMAAVDELLLAQPETEYAFTTAGGVLFASATSENALVGFSTITLKPGSTLSAYVDRVNGDLRQLPVVNTLLRLSPESVRGLILSNSPVRGDIDIALQGTNPIALAEAGQQVLAALDERATLATFRPDAEQPQAEVQIHPDWERAADMGLSAQALGNTVQTALDGRVPTQLQRQDRLVDVRVQLAPGTVQQPAQLATLPLFPATGAPVQLGDVAEIALGQAPGEIQRINQRQVYLIGGSLTEGASLSEALAEVDAILAEVDLPSGVTVLPGSNAAANAALRQSLGTLAGLAVFLVFGVMAVQYNSLIDPLVIMLTVPLALAGGILGLVVTQTALGATVVVGAVLLVGIVVNNAIILVELANQIYTATGCSRDAAMVQAAPRRLRPILMTTLTTVLGLFPLALGIGRGAEVLQPLGIVVFSGLGLATLLTLLVIPCVYSLLHGWLDRPPSPSQAVGKRPVDRATP